MAGSGTDDRIIEAAPGRGAAMQVLRVVLIGCAVAAVFGSAPMLAWTQALPDAQPPPPCKTSPGVGTTP